jgi:MFS superfamily sulfate permease-like transporter
MSETGNATPPSPAKGRALQADVLSGFLVFLIALPLCLGIAKASGYPPIAGVWTAILGGLLCTFISNSQMTIKGPAAGLIVIVLGAVSDFGAELVAKGMSKEEAAAQAYRLALGVGVIAGAIQIAFGLLKAGVLVDLFPISAVHGLLASIGVIIIFKQAYTTIGLSAPGGEAIRSVFRFPEAIPNAVRDVALIGVPSLVILVALTFVTNKTVRKIPGPVFVLLFAVPMGYFLSIDAKYLVPLPNVLDNPESAFARPNFEGVPTAVGIRYIILFSLIGSLESLLSAKAVDLLDPFKRKTDLNRDLLAVGVANTVASAVGGLPMISEIVRSKANIDYGARSRFANLFHGLFLLVAVLFLAEAIRHIPLAALGAMLVFTGYRLAHPREFYRAFKIGVDQLLIFVTTVVVVLFTDLLIGIAAGVAVKFLTLFARGISPAAILRLDSTTEARPDGATEVRVRGPVVFTNWVRLKNRLIAAGGHVVLDVSEATFIDHTSIEKLHDLEADFRDTGRKLEVEGMGNLQAVSSHNLAARKRKAA